MMRVIGVLLAAGLVGLGLAGCGNDGGGDTSGTTTTAEGSTTPGEPSTSGSGSAAAPEAPLDQIEIAATQVAEVESPTALVVRPGSPVLYVAERAGRVRPVTVNGSGRYRTYEVGDPVLDITDNVVTDGEHGLLDIEFSADGGTLYVHYSLAPSGDARVAAFTMAGDEVDTGSYRELLTVEDLFPNHNGGELALGPDGYLYIALGDGGGGGDPEGNGQDTQALLGKILRIDPANPSDGRAYGIPADNPFADGEAGRPEVWLYGVRNPWRFSFDRANGDLWIGDVGQGQWEEIDQLPAAAGGGRGANLGWNEMEATHPFEGGSNPDGGVLPVFEYSHDEGCSVTGGVVYRGSAIPGLGGAYLFGDYCQGDVRALRVRDGEVTEERTFDAHVDQVVSFAQDADGEVYALSLSGGIYRLDAAG
ncbi:MAG TPA: PQQ-dependent sugar dehydrogenase [Acidimicrobiales bacterium]|nr:PQQ-dependent sugar dehydrogenase [Acidimicrobiales bacterium]